jgi:diacylglycerol kinase family enzyme
MMIQTLFCRKEGHNVEVRVTYESGDSERFVAEALQNNSDVIVAAGGDGSVNEVHTHIHLREYFIRLLAKK